MYQYTKILIILLCFLSLSYVKGSTPKQVSKKESLDIGFQSPPDSIQTSVYWYWISGHISKEGVVKDLHSMKAVGINHAFIGNIGLDNFPQGKVKMFTNEWWEILHTALKTATELGIDIGIFNSPGWSQSGGPWVKPQESMRYLTSSETEVIGPKQINLKLEKPNDFFQDVRVLAWKNNKNATKTLNNENASISSDTEISDLSYLLDNDEKTGIDIPSSDFVIDIKAQKPFPIQSLQIKTKEQPSFFKITFQIKENNYFKTIKEFEVNRSTPNLNVGFIPYAPVVVSVPKSTATEFRLLFHHIKRRSGISDIVIGASPKIERYSEKTLSKMWPTPLPPWDAYLWEEQPQVDKTSVIQADEVLDITQNMSADGSLNWNVPRGSWTISRVGLTTTNVTNAPASPEARGLEIDKMNREHIKSHFSAFIGEILRKIPEEDRKCFKVVVQDSYETGGQNFTDNFIDKFKQQYNYDPTPYLLTFNGHVIDSPLKSDRFLWDLRRLIADMIAYEYVGGLREECHKHGLTTWLENYGHWGFPGEFLQYGGQSDEVAGEFWSEGNLGDIENRAASSCGHIYGKRKISAESNTVGGGAFSRHPALFKQRGDKFFAEGINNTLLHVYISQPYEDKNPGVNAWFGNEFNRKNTWFSQLDVYLQYLKRVNFMLQQGLNVADVAYFIGEDAPKMTGITDPPLPVGYQFDYINAEVILRDMSVKNGFLTLPHGTQYKVLVLPKLETMRPEVLKKIKQLVYDGAIVLGPAPKKSPSLQNQPLADKEIMKMATELWANVNGTTVKHRKYGQGLIMTGMTMEEVFKVVDYIPDCKLPQDNSIHFGHRTLKNGTEIYFISNQTDKQQVVTPAFRVKNMQPELWEPTTGCIRTLPAFDQKPTATAVPLILAPFESTFIVFRHKSDKNPQSTDETLNYPQTLRITEITNNWVVVFDTLQMGKSEPVFFDTLKDWTTCSDDQIKYFSGTATYQNTFKIDSLSKYDDVEIDLGKLTSMAKIYVNGHYVGGVWTYPYRLKISPYLRSGVNELKIEVVNNWKNRLIGDMHLPEKQRETWCFVNPYKQDSPLQPSGLFGPVTINKVIYYSDN